MSLRCLRSVDKYRAEQDLHTVLGQFLGVAFKAIGALCEAVVEIGGHIDDLEARRDW
jgi:hypothetical protein